MKTLMILGLTVPLLGCATLASPPPHPEPTTPSVESTIGVIVNSGCEIADAKANLRTQQLEVKCK